MGLMISLLSTGCPSMAWLSVSQMPTSVLAFFYLNDIPRYVVRAETFTLDAVLLILCLVFNEIDFGILLPGRSGQYSPRRVHTPSPNTDQKTFELDNLDEMGGV